LQNFFKTEELFKSFSYSKWHSKNTIEDLIQLGFPNKFFPILDFDGFLGENKILYKFA
jgi:hypothetical protein